VNPDFRFRNVKITKTAAPEIKPSIELLELVKYNAAKAHNSTANPNILYFNDVFFEDA
jgi:hypothetical protein